MLLNTWANDHFSGATITRILSRTYLFPGGDPPDILVVEMTGDSESEVHFKLGKLDERINKGVRPYATTRIMRPSDQAKVWAMRQAGLGLMMKSQVMQNLYLLLRTLPSLQKNYLSM
ncbi:MAG: hypothetical protein CM1200mP39_27780 [Dehalococcoidia bacterium]|nr:MAG: hypothetical protein CM1200mP39_27780 [Dehalococcoidia bacterium]